MLQSSVGPSAIQRTFCALGACMNHVHGGLDPMDPSESAVMNWLHSTL